LEKELLEASKLKEVELGEEAARIKTELEKTIQEKNRLRTELDKESKEIDRLKSKTDKEKFQLVEDLKLMKIEIETTKTELNKKSEDLLQHQQRAEQLKDDKIRQVLIQTNRNTFFLQ
jgi:hypothetical protein